jgi:hypothetical protein
VRLALAKAIAPTVISGAGFLVFGAIDVMRRGSQPAVVGVIGVGLTAVVFFTYLILGVMGYRMRADGTVRVPLAYACLVILLVVLGIGAAAYVVLRAMPESWR